MIHVASPAPPSLPNEAALPPPLLAGEGWGEGFSRAELVVWLPLSPPLPRKGGGSDRVRRPSLRIHLLIRLRHPRRRGCRHQRRRLQHCQPERRRDGLAEGDQDPGFRDRHEGELAPAV